jgi:hypothetical protein
MVRRRCSDVRPDQPLPPFQSSGRCRDKAARTARRKSHPSRTPLIGRRRPGAPLTLGSQQPPANASTPFPLVQLSSNALLPVAATQSWFPSAPSQQRLLRPNPHRACCNRHCPLSAISCLGASRTPAVGARGWPRHAGVRETCTVPDDQPKRENHSWDLIATMSESVPRGWRAAQASGFPPT